MTTDEFVPQATVPLARDNELRLAKMRGQLEDVFHHLNAIHDEISVTADSAQSKGMPAIANVLSMSVCHNLFRQLKSLTNVIERLGGTTELSETDSGSAS